MTDATPLTAALGSACAMLLAAANATPAATPYNDVSTVDDSGKLDVGLYTSIAIGSDDLPIISYYDDTSRALKVAHCEDNACATPATITVIDDDPTMIEGRYSAITIGNDGMPVISYQGDTGASLRVAKCVDVACSSIATITDVFTATPPNITSTFTSITIGNNGRPVISYTDDGLNVARCANAQCTGTAIVTTVDSGSVALGYATSIAIGMDGFPIVSYYDLTNGALKTSKCGNSACSSGNTIREVDSGGVGDYTSLGVRSGDGIPLIAYHDAAHGALKLAICANVNCNGATVLTLYGPSGESVGLDAHMVLGNAGKAFISHRNETTNALMMTACVSETCTDGAVSSVLDSGQPGGPALGQYTSIAIGADNKPIISYHDAFTGALKVAHCRTRSCDGLFRDGFE
jgi:hypothetical protein